jgi:hypothetical protein
MYVKSKINNKCRPPKKPKRVCVDMLEMMARVMTGERRRELESRREGSWGRGMKRGGEMGAGSAGRRKGRAVQAEIAPGDGLAKQPAADVAQTTAWQDTSCKRKCYNNHTKNVFIKY